MSYTKSPKCNLYLIYLFTLTDASFWINCLLAVTLADSSHGLFLEYFLLRIFGQSLTVAARYIVYDVAQVNIKYLLKMNFKHKY